MPANEEKQQQRPEVLARPKATPAPSPQGPQAPASALPPSAFSSKQSTHQTDVSFFIEKKNKKRRMKEQTQNLHKRNLGRKTFMPPHNKN